MILIRLFTRLVIPQKGISVSGRLTVSGIRQIIWDMKAWRRRWCPHFSKKAVWLIRLYLISQFRSNTKVSRDFLKEGEILIPLEKLYRRYTGESLAVKLAGFSKVTERIQYLTEQVEKITKLKNFGSYLTAMLEIDAFFLNEDRHTNNIAVIYQEETQQYALSPLFDQGLCLLADVKMDYPLELPLEACLEHIEAKPFSADFDEQLEAAEALYGIQLQFHFSFKEVQRELDQIAEGYSDAVRERVEQLLRQQIRKYAYLIKA